MSDYETTLTADRDEVAAVLTGVVDGLLAGTVRLGDGEDAVTVAVPDDLELEVELETEDDDVELELELEWPAAADAEGGTDDAPADAAGDGEAEETDDAGPDGGAPAAAEQGDSATAEVVAPADPVVPAGTDDGSGSLARFELYRDRADEWRWRLRHRNGNVIATSGEGYTRKHNARKGLRSVVRNAPGAEIHEED